ncbi:MAG: ABC transporter substrate-binding protein [Candidatus Binatia bacterium]
MKGTGLLSPVMLFSIVGIKAMSKRIFCFALCAMLFALSLPAEAQQRNKVYRIGYLAPRSVSKNFRKGLRELGYIEGQNLVIEGRFSKGKIELYPELAAELVRLRVELILAVGTGATRAAKQATSTIPIVMGNASADPVRLGLVASLARPGGNIAGVIDIMSDLAGKRLELLKESFPKLSQVAHLWARGAASGAAHLKGTEAAGRALGVRIQALEVPGPDDLESAFRAAVEGGADALIVVGTSFFSPHLQRIVNLEVKNRLPAMHTHARWVPAGGLMSHRTNNLERYRRAATYVDRILKGTKPANLPVERMTKFVFEINLKTAKQLGITIPPNVLYQATEVIK